MSDPIKDLENFPTMPTSHLPASEVRRRGDRMHRRHQALSTVAGVAAVAVIATAATVLFNGGSDNADPGPVTHPTETVSEPTDAVLAPLTEANLLADTDVTRDGILPWMAGETSPGDGQSTENACQQSGFSELGGQEIYERSWWVETHSLTQVIADFSSTAEAKGAYDEVRGWLATCNRPRITDYQSVPIDVAVEGADEAAVVDGNWTDPELEEGGESFRDQREITGVVLVDNRITMVTHHMPTADYGWRYTPVEALLPGATQLLREEGGVPGTDSGESDPLAQFHLPEPPASALVGQGDVPDVPLTDGFEDYSGDDGEQKGPAADLPGIDQTLICGKPILDQEIPSTGRWLASNSGPEFDQLRQLVGYQSPAAAAAQMQAIRQLVTSCPEDLAESDDLGWGAQLWRLHEADLSPWESLTFSHTTDVGLGGGIIQVVQVERALLIVVQHAEYSRESIASSVAPVTADTKSVLTPVCAGFRENGC